MSALAAFRGRLARALPGDSSAPLLACMIALLGFLATLGGGALVLLGDDVREKSLSLGDALTLQIPASASTARIEMSLALLRQTAGIRSVRLLEPAETARLLEPWLGPAAATDTLPVPRLVDVTVEPHAAIDVAGLRQRLASIASGALLEDHRLALDGFRGAAFRAEALIALGLAAVAALGGALTLLMTRTRLALHRATFELFHLIGAADGDLARPIQADALIQGLLGGAIGAVLAVVALTAVGGAIAPVRLSASGFADWRLWGVAIAVALAAGLIATGGARIAVLRQLARMP